MNTMWDNAFTQWHVMQVNDLQEQVAKSHAACSEMLTLGSILDRERIEKARLQANLSTARIERYAPASFVTLCAVDCDCAYDTVCTLQTVARRSMRLTKLRH